MKKLLLVLVLMAPVAVFAAPSADDNPLYVADSKAWQATATDCTAAQTAQKTVEYALLNAGYSCAGLNFDAQQPGEMGRRLAQGLYSRYCVNPTKN